MSELKQTIRFCRADDGVRLAYSTMGKGPPLVRAAHFLTHHMRAASCTATRRRIGSSSGT
jgi:hypothetical protein